MLPGAPLMNDVSTLTFLNARVVPPDRHVVFTVRTLFATVFLPRIDSPETVMWYQFSSTDSVTPAVVIDPV